MIWISIFIFTVGLRLSNSLEGYYQPPRGSSLWGYFSPPLLYRVPTRTHQSAMDAMVDITNNLGVTILKDHSYSKGNFAFSPYGVASVLVVLYEGACGESASQIHRAIGFPFDKDVIRVGFRSIHRHLRSYFSHEGYLSGISLNKEGSALKPEFKRILKFYGYDVDVNHPTDEDISLEDLDFPSRPSAGPTGGSNATSASPQDDNQSTNKPNATEGSNNKEKPTQVTTEAGVVNEKTTEKPESSTEDDSSETDKKKPSDTEDDQNEKEKPKETSTDGAVTEGNKENPESTTEGIQEPGEKENPDETGGDHNDNKEKPDKTSEDDDTSEKDKETTEETNDSTQKENEAPQVTDEEEKDKEKPDETSTQGGTTEETNEKPESTTEDSHDSGENETPDTTGGEHNNNKEKPDKTSEDDDTSGKDKETTEGTNDSTQKENETTQETDKDQNDKEKPDETSTQGVTTEETKENPETTTENGNNSTQKDEHQNGDRETEKPDEDDLTTEVPSDDPEKQKQKEDSENESTTAMTTTKEETEETSITTPSDLIVNKTEPPKDEPEDLQVTPTEENSQTGESSVPTLETESDEKTSANLESPMTSTSNPSEETEVTQVTQHEVKTTASLDNGMLIPQSNDLATTTPIVTTETTEELDSRRKRNAPSNGSRQTNRISVRGEMKLTGVEPFRRTLHSSGRRKSRTITDYLKWPPASDVSLQLQNGMFDSHVSRNLELYRSLPRLLFLVDGAIDTPVPMMTYSHVFPFAYIPRLHTKVLEFPLDDVRYKLLILLPVERRGLRQLIYDLTEFPLREVFNSLQPTRVRTMIPPFMVEGFVILTTSLQKLGIWDVFDPRKSNLSGMSIDPELYVRNVEQSVTVVIRNYVEILDIQTRTMAARNIEQDFEATHPFLYFVLDTATNVALMAGQILDPLNSRIY